MNVVCFAGYSGAGKTTLIERLIGVLRQRGLRVSVAKHAHHAFDVDKPGKDSWRHRQAGAFEVVVASDQRFVLMRENAHPADPSVHRLIAALDDAADWVLVEGFKHSDLPKIEVWRAATGKDVLYPADPLVLAMACTARDELPEMSRLPRLDLDDAASIADWLQANAGRFVYEGKARH